jgi:hypothetical protein
MQLHAARSDEPVATARHRCTSCGAAYGEEAWRALPLVERLGHDEVAHLMSAWPWPTSDVIEVRDCRCGASLVRRTPACLPAPR